MNLKKVLVLSPHTDDGELGAGGTIARLLEEGKDLYYVAFSGCETSVPNGLPKDILRKECMKSTKVMGIPPEKVTLLFYQVRTFPDHRQQILEDLVKLKNQLNPELVLVPSSQDVHQDHGTIYHEALRAFKREASIWGYELPWNNVSFTTEIFVRLKPEHLEKKLLALKEYASQKERGYMNEKNTRSLCCTRGAQLDTEYAETFELIRLIY
ncbi:MAG: PIG-L deacetylase family protein [Dehalococcoidales bacterium]|nr:PIG-L deacetylase family protein [Dehalococcoidales bacterium]